MKTFEQFEQEICSAFDDALFGPNDILITDEAIDGINCRSPLGLHPEAEPYPSAQDASRLWGITESEAFEFDAGFKEPDGDRLFFCESKFVHLGILLRRAMLGYHEIMFEQSAPKN